MQLTPWSDCHCFFVQPLLNLSSSHQLCFLPHSGQPFQKRLGLISRLPSVSFLLCTLRNLKAKLAPLSDSGPKIRTKDKAEKSAASNTQWPRQTPMKTTFKIDGDPKLFQDGQCSLSIIVSEAASLLFVIFAKPNPRLSSELPKISLFKSLQKYFGR